MFDNERVSETQLSENEQRLRSLFDHNPEAVFSLDSAGCFTALNATSTLISGYPVEELIGRPFLFLVASEARALAQDVFLRVMDGVTCELELAIIDKHGSRIELDTKAIPIVVGGEIVGVYGIARDITAQKQTEAALRASERRFRQVLETIQLLGLIVDRSGRVIFCNDCLCECFGRRRAEILDSDVCDLIFPLENRENLRQEMLRYMENGDVPPRGEFELRVGAGRRFIVAWQFVLLQDATGVTGMTCIGEDITKRRQEEASLKRALKRERRIADALQETLLLTAPPDVLQGLSVAPLYQPALDEARIGGDFYDTIPLPSGRIALVVGDAAGKGLAAATRTAEAKFVLRAYLRESPDPARALARLNAFVAQAEALEGRREDTFITVCLVVIEPETGTVVYATAGADPPLFLRADGTIESGNTTGLPLGVVGFDDYHAEITSAAPGDTILMATDGIIEARNGRSFFGRERLEETALESLARGLSLPQMGEEILLQARDFAGGSLQDDVCLLLARLA